MSEQFYPGIFDRVKAVMTDSLVLVALMIAITAIFSAFEHIPDSVRITAYILLLLYDPLLTSFFGATLGHMVIGLRVKRENRQDKNITILLAIIRFIIKALLGWISLLIVMSNEKRQAIHDYIVGSVVVYKNDRPSD